jgi:two-component system response regulator YesN
MSKKPQWNMLIADDEWIIRDGLKDVIPWEPLGLQLVGEAEDGEEALALALEKQADIALVDINMPMMSGLQFVSRIRKERPGIKIVILTGYGEFSYAQEAIRLQVDDYLLKPVNPEQLASVLEKMIKELEAESKEKEHLQAASKQVEKNFTLLRERFCLEWIDGALSSDEIRDQLAFLKLPPVAPDRIGIIRWIGHTRSNEWVSEKDKQLYLYAIENIAGELLSRHPFFTFRDHMGMTVLFVWGNPAEEVLASLEETILTYVKVSTAVCFEPNVDGLLSVPSVYQAAKASVFKQLQLSPFVRKSKELLDQRYKEANLTLELVAGELNVSAVYLSRIFKQETGTPFVHYLTQTRVKHAIQLLTGTDLAMHEIAERIGYDSQHYFSTAFKKATGLSPNQYRKEGPKW